MRDDNSILHERCITKNTTALTPRHAPLYDMCMWSSNYGTTKSPLSNIGLSNGFCTGSYSNFIRRPMLCHREDSNRRCYLSHTLGSEHQTLN